MDAAQIKAIFDMLAPIVGLATLLFGVVQYRNAQRWKKKELIAKEAKEFFADPAVKTALRLMDWHRCKIVVPSFETPHMHDVMNCC